MKKILFLGLLGSLLLLASCGTSTSKSEASANSSTTSTTNETTSVEKLLTRRSKKVFLVPKILNIKELLIQALPFKIALNQQ